VLRADADRAGAVRIRGGRGLGDALYIRPVAEEFVRRGRRVTVLSDYRDVFLGAGVALERFSRLGADVVAHYTHGKSNPATTQWQDVCALSGVDVPLRFTWNVQNADLVKDVKRQAGKRPIVLVHAGRIPMERTDGFGMELMPTRAAVAAALRAFRDCFLVAVGKARQLYGLPVALDLNGKTSVADLLDLASICQAVVAQCSFAIPMAEALGKPLLAVWGAGYVQAEHPFIRQTSPTKVFSSADDRFVMDNWTTDDIEDVGREVRILL
jgi:hypothetical protein